MVQLHTWRREAWAGGPLGRIDRGRVTEGSPFLRVTHPKPFRNISSKKCLGLPGRSCSCKDFSRYFLMFTSVVNGSFFYQKLGTHHLYLVSNQFAELLTHSNAPSKNFLSLRVILAALCDYELLPWLRIFLHCPEHLEWYSVVNMRRHSCCGPHFNGNLFF